MQQMYRHKNAVLFALFFAWVQGSFAQSAVVYPDTKVQLSLDEGSGAVALDSSGLGNNGSMRGLLAANFHPGSSWLVSSAQRLAFGAVLFGQAGHDGRSCGMQIAARAKVYTEYSSVLSPAVLCEPDRSFCS